MITVLGTTVAGVTTVLVLIVGVTTGAGSSSGASPLLPVVVSELTRVG